MLIDKRGVSFGGRAHSKNFISLISFTFYLLLFVFIWEKNKHRIDYLNFGSKTNLEIKSLKSLKILPVQLNPSPVNPSLQAQVYVPLPSEQVALSWHWSSIPQWISKSLILIGFEEL